MRKLHNRAVRIITNSTFDSPTKPLLSNLGLKSIQELIAHEVAVMAYKPLKDHARLYLKICLPATPVALRKL